MDTHEQTDNFQDLITLPELVERTGLSKSYWYKRCSARDVRHFKRGKTLLFDPADVQEFMRPRVIEPVGAGR